MSRLTAEVTFEENMMDELRSFGWDTNYSFRRETYNSPFDYTLITKKIMEINNVSEEMAKKAVFEIKKISGSATEQNYEGFKFFVHGIKIYDHELKMTKTLKIISENISDNHYGAIRQFRMANSDGKERYPDIVCFINGLPIIVSELKAPDANERLLEAFNQNESLKRHFPTLFAFNIFIFLSNNLDSKYGSVTSSFKKYFNAGGWSDEINPISIIFLKKIILEFIFVYSFFDNEKRIKYLAAPHQIEAVKSTINKMKVGDHKGGVVWHTQGSGKSVTMLMLTKMIIKTFPASTVLLITDRNSLDRQLFGRFSQASEYLLSIPTEVNSRKDLIDKLNDKKHFGIYFTTVQKFSEETGTLSNRSDIFVLIDEAHRTQNNIEGQMGLNKITKEFITKFGFAKYMRDAFPNAVLTGFTGTPLMGDKVTTDIFGGYNHKYSMNDSVADGSTVPIYYESRKLGLKLDNSYLEEMDKIQLEYAKTLDEDDVQSEQKMRSLLKYVQAKRVLEDPDVILAKTKDILKHLSVRKNVLNGKAMIVVSSRKAAFKYYESISIIEPERKDSTILVMTHNNKDSFYEERMIVPKHKMNEVANEFRKPDSKYKIAIVVDMWLTGFDVPDLDVMYIDKIIKWHNLMQAIARVNRTFEQGDKNKASGLIVDYLGIWKYLSDALIQYADGSSESVDIIPKDIEKARIKLMDEFDIINSSFIPRLYTFPELNPNEKYKFVINSLNNIFELSQQKRNEFILRARVISRLIKIVFTVIDTENTTIGKCIAIINSLITTKNTQDDDDLNITIEKIKEAIEKAVDAKESDVLIKATNINKDINQVAKLLENEAEQLKITAPKVAKKLLEDAINGRIANMKKFRPIFAIKASDKLKDILNALDKEEKLNKVIDMLIDLSKELSDKMNQEPEFKDRYLQAFFSILSDDEFLSQNKNSEVLKAIAKDLMDTIKENITEQFYINKKVKQKVAFKLRVILKNKYNYPPEKLGELSGILIDQINNTIEINKEYFINKKEVI